MLGSVRSVLIKKPGVALPNTLMAAYSFSEGSGPYTYIKYRHLGYWPHWRWCI
jgi:hypothetical protein